MPTRSNAQLCWGKYLGTKPNIPGLALLSCKVQHPAARQPARQHQQQGNLTTRPTTYHYHMLAEYRLDESPRLSARLSHRLGRSTTSIIISSRATVAWRRSVPRSACGWLISATGGYTYVPRTAFLHSSSPLSRRTRRQPLSPLPHLPSPLLAREGGRSLWRPWATKRSIRQRGRCFGYCCCA